MLVAPELSLKPSSGLSLALDQTFSRLWRRSGRSVFSAAVVSRPGSQYQFTKAASARAMIRYHLEERDALRDPTTGWPITARGTPVNGRQTGTFQGQFLLQYQPSLGTIFYVGYIRLMEGDFSQGLARKNPLRTGPW
jgi:hypothetical protein